MTWNLIELVRGIDIFISYQQITAEPQIRKLLGNRHTMLEAGIWGSKFTTRALAIVFKGRERQASQHTILDGQPTPANWLI
jgi:hypothetical protein